MLFDKEISKIDVAFFQRLRESNFWAEDKSVNGKYSLFNDNEYTDIEYHKNFPTIYHLRKQLIDSNDETNREGHAAKVYFNALFGKDFSRTADSPINAMLDYGYSIILSCINREIVSNGYLTQIGIFHNNMFNQFNLGCDLMEPFRTIIDRKVKTVLPQQFESKEKRDILELLSTNFIIDNRNQTLLNTIKIYVKSVFDALESTDISHIKFYKYEL